MLTLLRGMMNGSRRERGQVLVLAIAFFIAAVAVAALVIDAGFFLTARRDSQNTADAGALAGAQHIPDDPIGAQDAALTWASLNGWTNGVDGVTVTVNTPYNGDPNKIEVIVEGGARGVGFFDALMNVRSRAVAEVVITQTGSGPGDPGDGSPPMVPAPATGCGGDNAVVDGRVMPGESYEKIADLVGGATIFGEAFFACDGGYYYFAMRLNGPDTGGAVANENVYGPKAEKNGPPGYHETYDTGWGKHDFGALLNSDRARFQIACGTTPVHDFVQDYLRQDGSTWASDVSGDGEVIVAGPAASASSLEWNLEHPNETGWGDDPGEVPFVPGDKKLGQSPPFDPTYPDYDSEYDGWVWEMIYEFRVPRTAYDACTEGIFFGLLPFPGQTGPVGGIHSSPAKVAEGGSILLSTIEIRLVE